MATKMQQRRGSASEWASANPVLAEGEIGFETDTKIIKIGDGVTSWNNLDSPYLTRSEAAGDSEKLGGYDAADYVLLSNDAYGRHMGIGNDVPTLGMRPSDTFYYVDAAQMLMYHDDSVGWRYMGVATFANATSRDNAKVLYLGMVAKLTSDGTIWERRSRVVGGSPQTYWARISNETVRATLRRASALTLTGDTVLSFSSASAKTTAGMWSSSQPTRVVIPETGDYDVSIHLTIPPTSGSNGDGALEVKARINNETTREFRIGTERLQIWYPITMSAVAKGVSLVKDEYLVFYARQNGDATRNSEPGCSVTVELAD